MDPAAGKRSYSERVKLFELHKLIDRATNVVFEHWQLFSLLRRGAFTCIYLNIFLSMYLSLYVYILVVRDTISFKFTSTKKY